MVFDVFGEGFVGEGIEGGFDALCFAVGSEDFDFGVQGLGNPDVLHDFFGGGFGGVDRLRGLDGGCSDGKTVGG